jgi:hypothetical protein
MSPPLQVYLEVERIGGFFPGTVTSALQGKRRRV